MRCIAVHQGAGRVFLSSRGCEDEFNYWHEKVTQQSHLCRICLDFDFTRRGYNDKLVNIELICKMSYTS